MSEEKKSICLATYNIWNSSEGMPVREKYIIDEIRKINSDVICLQEVTSEAMACRLADQMNYQYSFVSFPGDHEGICVLSKMTLLDNESWIHDGNASYVSICHNEKTIGIVNVHLPWDSVLSREQCMIHILNKITEKNKEKKSDYTFVMGDFNCSATSDLQRMLLGECTIDKTEANPCFFDLAYSFASIANRKTKDTLNFRKNPRFTGNTIEINQRFDRIMLQNTYPNEFPELYECDIFGTRVYEDIQLSASDHYGVYVKLKL